MLKLPAATLVLTVALAAASASPAAAQNCYEDIGCPHQRMVTRAEAMRASCEGLAHFRNSIYQARGYCFRTARAIAQYGNEGCRYASQGEVPLNRFERANIATFIAAERDKGCR
jgi:hypothetical protein